MNIVKGIFSELRERKLWPVAVVLLVGLIAVPVLLAKSPATIPALATHPTTALASAGKGVSVKLEDSATQAALTGKERDPFPSTNVIAGATTSTPATTTPSTASTAAAATGSSGSGSATVTSTGDSYSGGSSSSESSSAGSSSSTSTSTPTPAATKTSQPAGLTDTESYQVALETSTSAGGVEPIDSLPRDGAVPSDAKPLLIQLGVQKGGHRVMFAVEPGTVLSGPTQCTPGPIDCEVVSVPVNGQETVSNSSTGQSVTFSVTAITTVNHPSVAAAQQARRTVDSAGAKLLGSSPLQALSLFNYEPSVGAVVDLRNLTVGGN